MKSYHVGQPEPSSDAPSGARPEFGEIDLGRREGDETALPGGKHRIASFLAPLFMSTRPMRSVGADMRVSSVEDLDGFLAWPDLQIL